ncbi:hypothetical protein [Pontibacter ruber]|uniref:Uncharacterized protein n=1 Tax=Pontibacter ruber TaxID=1343895 RepID=A0ABW5CYC4_9BACT|nr:hypothetical protein [Pontibacter ruber]
MQEQLQQAFSKITGLPLTKTTRNELIQYFHFGSTTYTTSQGLILDVGAYTLALNCPWQLQTKSGDVIRHNEVFMRKREAGMPSLKFDWKIPGANLRDQRLHELIQDSQALAVERIEPQENNGFILYFVNEAQLVVSPDPSKPAEVYWQFFSNTGDQLSIQAGETGITAQNI